MSILKTRNTLSILFIFTFVFYLFPISFATAQVYEDTRKDNTEEDVGTTQFLELITVTAQKRKENMQDVPMSVSAMSDVQIEDAGLQKTEDFVRHIPNLYIGTPGNHNGSTFLNMRGISTLPADASANPAVGFYVDGVYYSGGVNTELLDVDRIEVLRGPQGTLYGRNTEAGLIHIITRKPGKQFEGKTSLTFGNYNTRDLQMDLSGPIVDDKVYFNLAGKYLVSDGFIENEFQGDNTTNSLRDVNLRAGLRWTPSDAWDINLTVDYLKYRDGYDPFEPIDDTHTSSIGLEDTYDDQNAMGKNLNVEYTGSDFSVTSITSLRHWDEKLANDMDMTSEDISIWYQDLEYDTFSQEIRLASPKDTGSFKWLVGCYYFSEDKNIDMIYDMRQGYPAWGLPPYQMLQDNELKTNGYAYFGQVTYPLLNNLNLTGGLRFDHSSKTLKFKEHYNPDLSAAGMVTQDIEPDQKDYDEWLPKISLDYKWSEELMTYISYAEGFKGGGFNIYSSTVAGTVYKPEYSSNYEIGLKSSWLDGQLTANLAIFYIEWQDQQVLQFLGASDMFITNAAESTSKGFEVEFQAMPVTGLRLTAALGYTEVTFNDFIQDVYDTDTASSSYGQKTGEKDLSGKSNSYIPQYTYNIGAQYRSGNGLFGRIEFQGVGEYWFDAENTKKQDAYTLVNARLGYEFSLFEVVLWAKNLLDEEYVTIAVSPDSSNADEWMGAGGDPLTFGITLAKKF